MGAALYLGIISLQNIFNHREYTCPDMLIRDRSVLCGYIFHILLVKYALKFKVTPEIFNY